MKSSAWKVCAGLAGGFALSLGAAFAQEDAAQAEPAQAAPAAEEAAPSPLAEVMQVVGTTPITISYSSPGVKGRTIYGELQKFGENWRAGANAKTTIKFEEDVKINGQKIDAGAYGVYILLKSADEWEVVLNKNATGNAMEWDSTQDAVRVSVKPEDAPMRERLQYGFENFTNEKPYTTEVYMHWEKKKAVVKVEMAGGGGGFTLPEVSEEAKPILDLIAIVLKAAQAQDIEAMTAPYAEDFASDQGGGKAEMVEFLQGAKDQGFLEDMSVSLDNLEIEVEGDKATVDNVELEGAFGVLTLSFELQKRDGNWVVTYQAQY